LNMMFCYEERLLWRICDFLFALQLSRASSPQLECELHHEKMDHSPSLGSLKSLMRKISLAVFCMACMWIHVKVQWVIILLSFEISQVPSFLIYLSKNSTALMNDISTMRLVK
jgi:hypothetical protein